MEERYRGIRASLTLITMAALLVAFGSSSKRRSTEMEISLLGKQLQQLAQTNKILEERVRQAEDQCAHSRYVGKQLNDELLHEQAKNKALTLRLQRTSPPSSSETSER